MVILKAEMKKMDTRYNKLESVRVSLTVQLEAFGLEVSEVHNIKKTLLPTQETQTQMEDIVEQQVAVTSITTPVQPAISSITTQGQPPTYPEEYTLHQIQTTLYKQQGNNSHHPVKEYFP